MASTAALNAPLPRGAWAKAYRKAVSAGRRGLERMIYCFGPTWGARRQTKKTGVIIGVIVPWFGPWVPSKDKGSGHMAGHSLRFIVMHFDFFMRSLGPYGIRNRGVIYHHHLWAS